MPVCGKGHTHASVAEVKACYGLAPAPAPATTTTSYPRGYAAVDLITARQLNYIIDLGGDRGEAVKLTKMEASAYIDRLKDAKRRGRVPHSVPARVGAPVTVPAPYSPPPAEEPLPPEQPKTTKSDMVAGLIDMVQDGYFAVQRQEGERIFFLRVNRPKHGKMKDALKVQSQHGPSLEVRWVRWPSGHISRYRWEYDIEEILLLLIADWKGAAKRYADKMKKCARCNTKLTDPRSRYYGIGPECEQHWAWWIEEVNDEKGAWESLPASEQEKYFPKAGE